MNRGRADPNYAEVDDLGCEFPPLASSPRDWNPYQERKFGGEDGLERYRDHKYIRRQPMFFHEDITDTRPKHAIYRRLGV